MENTVKKVNVKEIMDRAKAKTEEVKESTEKVGSKIDNFRSVPGFSKYEFNGNILRNVKTKSILSLKAKNGKYQLLSDDGKNCDRSKEQIISLFPVQNKIEKEVKETKVKKEKVETGEKKQSLMFLVNLMFHQGKSKEEIMQELNIDNKKYCDYQWHYEKKNYKEKIEKYLSSLPK